MPGRMSARTQPAFPGLERRPDPAVVDAEVAVGLPHDRVGPDRLHLLRQHADIDLIGPKILEAIEADAFAKGADPDNVVFQTNVGRTQRRPNRRANRWPNRRPNRWPNRRTQRWP